MSSTHHIQVLGRKKGGDKGLHLSCGPPFKASFLKVSPNIIYLYAIKTTSPCVLWKVGSTSIVLNNTGEVSKDVRRNGYWFGNLQSPSSHYSGRRDYYQNLNHGLQGGNPVRGPMAHWQCNQRLLATSQPYSRFSTSTSSEAERGAGTCF